MGMCVPGDNLRATNKVAQNAANSKAITIATSSNANRPTSAEKEPIPYYELHFRITVGRQCASAVGKWPTDQQRELARAIEKGQKEIRALVDSGPGDVIDDSCGNACIENMIARYSQNRTRPAKSLSLP